MMIYFLEVSDDDFASDCTCLKANVWCWIYFVFSKKKIKKIIFNIIRDFLTFQTNKNNNYSNWNKIDGQI